MSTTSNGRQAASGAEPGSPHVDGALPAYLSGRLDTAERERVRLHLSDCAACRAALDLWQVIGDAVHERVPAPVATMDAMDTAALLDGVWARIDATPRTRVVSALAATRRAALWTLALVRVQARLVPWGIWSLSGVAILLCLATVAFWNPARAPYAPLGIFIPLVTLVGVAFLYGPDHDAGLEVALAAPTSPRAVLLARLSLVLGYDLALGLGLTTLLVLWQGGDAAALASYWVGPALTLGGVSLLLSLTVGNVAGVTVAGGIWLLRFSNLTLAPPGNALSLHTSALAALWQTNPLTLLLAAALLVAAVLYVPRQRRLPA